MESVSRGRLVRELNLTTEQQDQLACDAPGRGRELREAVSGERDRLNQMLRDPLGAMACLVFAVSGDPHVLAGKLAGASQNIDLHLMANAAGNADDPCDDFPHQHIIECLFVADRKPVTDDGLDLLLGKRLDRDLKDLAQ